MTSVEYNNMENEIVPTQLHNWEIKDFITSEGFDLTKLNDEQLVIFIGVLVKYIYNTVSIKSINYNGLTYYNRTSDWWERPEGVSTPHDPNYICEGYMNCDFGISEYDGHKIQEYIQIKDEKTDIKDYEKPISVYQSCRLELPYKNSLPIEYNLEYNPENIDNYDKDDCPEEYQVYELIMSAMKNRSINNIKLLYDLDFVIINDRGINEDHRGSDHTRIILDFHDNYVVKKNCTLHKFADACYRVKSHKFDYWYELYGWIKIKKSHAFLNIHLDFDHGS